MLVQTRKKLDIDMLLTALIGLLAGMLIQALLFSAEQREALALGRRAAENFAPQAAAVAESFLDREETALSEAQSRLRALTARKQKDYAAENRALLILVNPWNPMPADFVPQVGEVEDGYEMDLRAVEPLQEMMAACRAAGNDAYICSAFRTHAMQQSLFDNKVMRVMYEEGVPYEDAPEVAGQTVAVPGTSEHELGLATDIIDGGYPFLDEGQEETATQKWLMENAWRFGFILRYPNGTTDITGIIYEPWHYRYVGPWAEEIYRRGITLEEFLALRQGK